MIPLSCKFGHLHLFLFLSIVKHETIVVSFIFGKYGDSDAVMSERDDTKNMVTSSYLTLTIMSVSLAFRIKLSRTEVMISMNLVKMSQS